jgi:hypothetical protein
MSETAWLIERIGSPTPLWWSAGDEATHSSPRPAGFRSDANAALRFSRKCDAEAFIRFHCLADLAFASEHEWLALSGLQASSPRDGESEPKAKVTGLKDRVEELVEAARPFGGLARMIRFAMGRIANTDIIQEDYDRLSRAISSFDTTAGRG